MKPKDNLSEMSFTPKSERPNIESARLVLPREGWCWQELAGRELREDDLKFLAELGTNDPNFSWEREEQPLSYFENLLELRLDHYKRYGFGIHGVWFNGEFVGQFGLQVLDVENDLVEFALFLGEKFTGRGIGSKLVSELLFRCRESGMTSVFGVVRPENKAGLALIRKFGGVESARQNHFGELAIVFCFELI